MFANYEKKIIEMTKTESKAAGKVGTTEYETLKELRSEITDVIDKHLLDNLLIQIRNKYQNTVIHL